MMKEQSLISVSLPVYNGEAFLRETIESILSQTYHNFELIIVDDCSTDTSREIIDSFQDDRIRTIYLSENQNVCNAGNTAFSEARGKYIALIGHDDIWTADKLEKQVDYMEAHPECGVCFTWADIIDESGNVQAESAYEAVFRQQNQKRREWVRRLIYYKNCFCAPSALIRKETLDKTGPYRYTLLQLQDYELWIRIARLADIYIIREKLTGYRRADKEGTNLSALTPAVYNRNARELWEIQYTFLEGLSNEEFSGYFQDMMVDKEPIVSEGYECEKGFLLLKLGNPLGRYRIMSLMERESYRKVLKETYGYGLQDLYGMNAQPMFRDIEAEEKDKLLEQCRGLIVKQQDIIEKLRSN